MVEASYFIDTFFNIYRQRRLAAVHGSDESSYFTLDTGAEGVGLGHDGADGRRPLPPPRWPWE